jgi:3-deoxy-D-manno-octulosonate 8-phosphate phosphatase (KDO 8-P phosphatase)
MIALPQPELALRASAIELLLLDVDGVLTDGRVVYADDGTEIKRFHVRDGSGLKIWRDLGKRAAILSGRSSPAVSRRAAELGIGPVIQGRSQKAVAFAELLAEVRLSPSQVCAIGDDLPDIPVLRQCGLAIAVADACPELQAVAHYVTGPPGGAGAVRDAIEWLLRISQRWGEAIRPYLTEG